MQNMVDAGATSPFAISGLNAFRFKNKSSEEVRICYGCYYNEPGFGKIASETTAGASIDVKPGGTVFCVASRNVDTLGPYAGQLWYYVQRKRADRIFVALVKWTDVAAKTTVTYPA